MNLCIFAPKYRVVETGMSPSSMNTFRAQKRECFIWWDIGRIWGSYYSAARCVRDINSCSICRNKIGFKIPWICSYG